MRRAFFCSSAALRWEGGVSMVQGASRGIGLEFVSRRSLPTSLVSSLCFESRGRVLVRQLLEKSDKGHVIATCRNPDGATSLLDLKKKFMERLNLLQLDVTKESTIEVQASFQDVIHSYFFLLLKRYANESLEA
ncbi:hypothetical protein B296_00014339 [Ensete ventricosum]|uniref:Uncharacterized protein n=1 Tax=Ensete ventricosum TaxID=4639 RepID=A0A426ZWR8_ENSVE|nr:hypothetical protein B296_00014339 [Ensete ventricosum]